MGVFLTAEWHWLLMVNYEIDPEILRPYVPPGVALDTWNGQTFVSLVGFLFLDTRVLGLPIPFHRDFEEVNLRFYVRRVIDGQTRRGVVFIKEIVPKTAIAAVARWVYHENYVALPMSHRIDEDEVEYSWGRSNRIRSRRHGEPFLAAEGSQEEFITEHYWGYTAQPDGGCLEYRVEHPKWRLWKLAEVVVNCEAEQIYGAHFQVPLRSKPASAFLAEGSGVSVFRGRKI